MNDQDTRSTLLGRAMTENGLFSGVAGIVFIVGAAFGLGAWLGINDWLLAALGTALVVFAADLLWLARSSRFIVAGGRAAVVADVAWVVAAGALIAFSAVLTRQGEVTLAIVSLVVAGFAAAQWIGLSRLRDARGHNAV